MPKTLAKVSFNVAIIILTFIIINKSTILGCVKSTKLKKKTAKGALFWGLLFI